jgi:hypothetical protein
MRSMFKTISIIFLIISSVFAQGNSCLQQSLDYKYYSASLDIHSFPELSFFNDNLSFYNSSQTLNSSAKIFGELISGTAAGFGGAILVKNLFRYNKNEAELGGILPLTLIGLAAIYGNTTGVFLFGKIAGDEGSFKNTLFWSAIGSLVFFTAAKLFTDDYDKRFIAAAVGLPVGAVIGFNSNEFGEIISSVFYP